MTVTKLSVSFDPQLDADVRAAAEKAGLSVSAWLADVAADRLRDLHLREFLDAYEQEHGAFTPEELAAADAALGFDSSTDTNAA
jgi:hypothetical protein